MLRPRCATWAEARTSERVSAGLGGGQQRTHSKSSATDIDSNEPDDRGLAEHYVGTSRELRKVGNGHGCETGDG